MKKVDDRLNFKESLGHFCCLSRNIDHVVVIYKLTNIQWRVDGDFLDKRLRQVDITIAVKFFAFSNFSSIGRLTEADHTF